MHSLMSCKRCKTYLGGREIPTDPNLFLYCSQECHDIRETEGRLKRQEELRSPINLMANAAFRYVPKDPVDMDTGKVVKINKTTGKPRKKREEKGPRKCGRCGGSGHNARTCTGR